MLIARPSQPLERHLLEVKGALEQRMSESFFAGLESKYRDAILLAGFLHDIGKGEVSIQAAFRNCRKPLISHSALSFPVFAILARQKLGLDVFTDAQAAAIAFALLAHHSPPHPSLEKNLLTKLDLASIKYDPEVFKLLDKHNLSVTEPEVLDELRVWRNAFTENNIDRQLSHTFGKARSGIRTLFVRVYDALVKADWAAAGGDVQVIRTIGDNVRQRASFLVEPARSPIHADTHCKEHLLSNLLLEMPTGFGKTYIGTALALRSGQQRVIYTLPITTIIEDVHDRLRKELGNENVNWYTSRFLSVKATEQVDMERQEYEDARYFNAPVSVTTLDQVLTAWLNVDRYPLKEAPLYDSCLVLDEPQLYSPFMLLLFARLFPEYADRVRLIVMSATIPRFLRVALGKIVSEPFAAQVPVLFSQRGRTKLSLARLSVPILADGRLTDEAARVLKEGCESKLKIAVIVNTVRRAQQVYEQLNSWHVKRFLMHARYMMRDKRTRLRKMKALLGQPGPLIVVATQMIEAGVDVSFDMALREMAPLDSIVQTAGRVNRYGEMRQPGIVYIFGTGDQYLPYHRHQIDTTSRILEDSRPHEWTNELQYHERLAAYWDELDNWILSDMAKADEVLRRRAEITPFALDISKSDVDLRGGYLTVSAVPQRYIDEVVSLAEARKTSDDFWERKKLLGKIESFFVEVPYHGRATSSGKFCDYVSPVDSENYPWLNMLSLEYDSELGVVPKVDNMV